MNQDGCREESRPSATSLQEIYSTFLCLPSVDAAPYVPEFYRWCTLGTVLCLSHERNLHHRFVAQLLCQTKLYWGHFKLYAQQQRRLRELNTTRHIVFTGWLSHRPKCPLSSWCAGTVRQTWVPGPQTWQSDVVPVSSSTQALWLMCLC